MSGAVIQELTDILRSRRNASPEASYTASLFAGGVNGILQKVGEEATEVLLAAKDAAASGGNAGVAPGRDAALIHEMADLWFHCLVLLVQQNQDPQWVLDELERRLGVSGHEEKAQRAGNPPIMQADSQPGE